MRSIWALVLLFCCAGPTIAQNLLPHGNFESGHFLDWDETGSAAISSQNARSGTYCARLTTGDLRDSFPTTPGLVYKVTGWVRIISDSGNDWGGFRVEVTDYQSWQQLGHSGFLLASTHGNQYFKVSFNFTATASASRLQIGYFGGPGRLMTVYVDDFSVELFNDNQPPQITAATLTPNTVSSLPATQTYHLEAADPDGTITTIRWDFGDGARASTADGSRRIVGPGTFTARVTVVDDDGAASEIEVPWSAFDPSWPALSLSTPSDGAQVNSAEVTVAGTSSVAEVLVSTDREKTVAAFVSNGSFSTVLSLVPGWNHLLVQARHPTGRIATLQRRVRFVPPEPLAIANITLSSNTVERWTPLEISFEIIGSAATNRQHPYDPTPEPGLESLDGITADALFTPDNWSTVYRRPAFWRQPYSRELRSGEEWLYPTGAAGWCARFSPPSPGPWQFRIEVTEAKGSSVSTVGSFTVTEAVTPDNRGPVRVAINDLRYFEYADGTPYLGAGHGAGLGAERYSYDLENLFAAVGPANQQLFRVWIAGHLWGSAWQPWSSRTLPYDGTVPPTALDLSAAFGDGLASWRLDAANPILFQGFMSGHAGLIPGRTYRLRVRWRTENIAGPLQPGQPFGACVKFVSWPEPGATGTLPALVPHVNGDTPWHVALADFTAQGDLLPNLALILENSVQGIAWVDEVALHEVLADRTLGPQLLRAPRANSHLEFDQRRAAGLEAVLSAAEASDKQLRLVIAEKQEWLMNRLGPRGLPVPLGGQFFAAAGTPGRWLHESYWRHLFARFGASRAVHSWELVNEAPPGPGAHFALANRLAELARADGNPHPGSISTWATLATDAWTHPDYPALDHADFHAYVRNTGWLAPISELANDSARLFHQYDLAARAALPGRPIIWGEMGIDGPASTDNEDPGLAYDTAGVWLHKILWARCGPGGVIPLYWWQDNIFNHNLHSRFGAWRRFMEGIPLNNGRYVDAAATASPGLRVIGQKDPFHGRAHLWIDNPQHTWRRVVDGESVAPASGTILVNLGRAGASVLAEWFDTATGIPQRQETLRADATGTVTLSVTNLATDTAVKLLATSGSQPPAHGDWPQHQRDAARTGRTEQGVAPPYRARWIWAGPTRTLRNRESEPGWPDDLNPRPGYTYPGLPANSGVTLAQSVQPVVAAGRVFFGSMEGIAWALAADDGSTLWQRPLPGPTISTAAVVGTRVVFTCVTGEVAAFDVADGSPVWVRDTGRAITSAPCIVDGLVIVGSQDGRVRTYAGADGTLAWQSAKLGPSIHGGLAAANGRVFVGTEDMRVHALSLNDGSTLASRQVRGQSFRMLWPVVHGGRVWVSTVTTPMIGSEYIGESNTGSQLFADSPTLAAEEDNILRWLSGDTNGGRWPDAGADWRRLFALDEATLEEPFVIPAAPADGVGIPAQPPVVDNTGRVLAYFKTRHPRLTAPNGIFGTNYSVDICAINQTTGRRIPIDNGRLANPWPWETDNLYAMSVAGTQLWLRQNFRGTQMIDLATSTAHGVSAEVRNRDGGVFNFDVIYKDTGDPIATPQWYTLGRSAPVIVGGRVYFAEDWGITALEHRP